MLCTPFRLGRRTHGINHRDVGRKLLPAMGLAARWRGITEPSAAIARRG
jgi:hypothetical protein